MASIPDPPKTCTKCGEAKPVAEYYVKDRRSGRLFSRCKACHVARTAATLKAKYAEDPKPFKDAAKAAYAADPEKHRARAEAYRRENIDAVRARGRAAEATPEYRAKKAAYRLANAERRRAYDRLYRRLNAAAIREADRAYREANPEIYRAAVRRWQAGNPEKSKAIRAKAHANRRAIMARVDGSFTVDEWLAIKERHGSRCLRCGKHESEVGLSVDHVLPISMGGRNDAANLQPLCSHCNSVKRDKFIDFRP